FHDFRRGASYGNTPFRDDPFRKAFYRSLFEVPELLYTTVWRLDGKIISARIDFVHREGISLGLAGHSPFLAKASPGTLHHYLLGCQLATDGIAQLDLTTGGDSYKERFATHHDTVHRLIVYFSAVERMREAAEAELRRAARRILVRTSVTPNQI